MANLTILVTGANKGIGYSIVKGIAEKAQTAAKLILASRDPERGAQAVSQLKNSGNSVDYLQLDISDPNSVRKAVAEVKEKYGGIDILVNNAGIATKGDAFDADIVRDTLATNYYGTKDTTESFLPLIRPGGRIIFISSTLGKRSFLKSEDLKKRFGDADIKEVHQLLQEFQRAVEDGTYAEKGWQKSAYGVSKVAVSAYAGILAHSKELQDKKILSFAVCPGWCRTDMAGDKAPKSADQGAETPVYLALAKENEIAKGNGKFWTEGAVAEW